MNLRYIITRTVKAVLLPLAVLLSTIAVSSCSDDPELPSPDASVEETEDGSITSFSIESEHFMLPADLSEIGIALMAEDGEVYTYSANVENHGSTLRFSMEIPAGEKIADGSYVMTLSTRQGLSLPGRLKVLFSDRRVVSVNSIAASYPLKGAGTSSDPFIIGSSDDFGTFGKAVHDDAAHAAGLVFRQTADLELISRDTDSGYMCDTFAGIYDGGGKSVSMEISSPICGTAMFGTLTGSASISNLTFSNAGLSSEKDYCAVVAGRVAGDVTFSNITVTGAVTGRNYVGSLAGHVTGGSIVMSGVTVAVSVIGHGGFCGGLVGKIEKTRYVSIKDCSVEAPVEGAEYVGGAFGEVDLDSSSLTFDVNGLKISYPFSNKAVMGNTYVGGMAGSWRWALNKKMSVSSSRPVEVSMSVEGTQSGTGGVFGRVENGGINLDDFRIGGSDVSSQPFVHGVVDVGGIAGVMVNSSLYGSQYLELEPKDKGMAKIPDPARFKSSFDGSVKGLKNVGGIVGTMSSSSLLHICSGAKIYESGENIGGLVGSFDTASAACSIEDCTFKGELDSSSAENLGGIVGYLRCTNEGLVEDCVNYSAIVGGYYTGGIIGYVRKEHDYSDDDGNRLEINWCVNAADIEGSFNVGGIVGRTYSADTKLGGEHIEVDEVRVSNCMNAKTVIARGGNSEEALGGIVGRSGALTLVTLCANHGMIEGRGKLHAIGGIVGRLGQDGTLNQVPYYNSFATESINTASINSTNPDARVGGIAGYAEEGGIGYGLVYVEGIVDCRNSGKILPDQKDDTGGILGCSDDWVFISSNFNNGKVMHGNALLGTQKRNGHQYWGYNYTLSGCGGSWPLDFTLILSASKVTDPANFTGFDFDKIWEMTADGPNLRNNRWRDPASAKI